MPRGRLADGGTGPRSHRRCRHLELCDRRCGRQSTQWSRGLPPGWHFHQSVLLRSPWHGERNGTSTPSTPVAQPTTLMSDAADLHALLTAARVTGPYVLVGWSFGGPIARFFASTYPQDVAGLVLVDGTSEYLQSALSPADFTVFLELARQDDAQRVAQWKDVEQFDPGATFAQLRAAPPVPRCRLSCSARTSSTPMPSVRACLLARRRTTLSSSGVPNSAPRTVLPSCFLGPYISETRVAATTFRTTSLSWSSRGSAT